MANQATANPIVIDTAAAGDVFTGPQTVRLIQWIDDAADIADNDDLVMSINGVTLTTKLQLDNPGGTGLAQWTIGPFNPGISVKSLKVTTLDHGVVHVWLD